MTIFPFNPSEAFSQYGRAARLKPSAIVEREEAGASDKTTISAEAKKRQIMNQAKQEVLERIRNVK